MKVKTPAGGADKNRNDSSTANCESTHATQDVSTALLYSKVHVIYVTVNSHSRSENG